MPLSAPHADTHQPRKRQPLEARHRSRRALELHLSGTRSASPCLTLTLLSIIGVMSISPSQLHYTRANTQSTNYAPSPYTLTHSLTMSLIPEHDGVDMISVCYLGSIYRRKWQENHS